MMQKIPCKDFGCKSTSLDEEETTLQRILITPDDSDHGYYEKLILDQNNKREYMFHYRMLEFYVNMGVKAAKFHSVNKF